MELCQEILVISEVCVPLINFNNSLCRGLECYSSRSHNLHDAVEANWMVRYLNRSINLSAFSTVNAIRLHPGSVLVTMYHW